MKQHDQHIESSVGGFFPLLFPFVSPSQEFRNDVALSKRSTYQIHGENTSFYIFRYYYYYYGVVEIHAF